MQDQITIGYLCWKRHEVFKQTLNSHKDNGLFELIPPENRVVFFQEISEHDITIADEFECNYIGNDKNIGILNAFIALVENCKTDYFMFSENDWNLIENKNVAESILSDCIYMLNNNITDIVGLRHRKYPGVPLYTTPTDVEEWLKCPNLSNFAYKLESLSWLPFPNEIYNNVLEEFDRNHKWYTAGFNNFKWSNNIFIGKTEYLKNIVLPLLKTAHDNFKNTDDNYNNYTGMEYILVDCNRHIGINTELDACICNYANTRKSAGYGLFTHKDKV